LAVQKAPGMIFGKYGQKDQKAFARRWGVMFVTYVYGLLLIYFLDVPRLGVTEELARQLFASFPPNLQPKVAHNMIALGCFYFGVLGGFELVSYRLRRFAP